MQHTQYQKLSLVLLAAPLVLKATLLMGALTFASSSHTQDMDNTNRVSNMKGIEEILVTAR